MPLSSLFGILSASFACLVSAQLPGYANDENFSEPSLSQFVVDYYTSDFGFSASGVLDLAQSSEGYVWIGTYDGLNRFDGLKNVVFNRINSPILPIDPVTAVYASSDGALWIGTLGAGAFGLVDYSLKSILPDSRLPSVFVNDFVEDEQGRIWMGTREGLYCFDNGKWREIFLNEENSEVSVYCFARGGSVQWLASEEGVFRLDQDSWVRAPFDIPETSLISSLAYHDDFGLWIGTAENGLYHLKDQTVAHFGRAEGLPSDSIGDVIYDKMGSIWVGCRNGVARRVGEQFSVYKLEGKKVHALEMDHEGGIWAGTYQHGLYRFHEPYLLSFASEQNIGKAVVGRAVLEKDDKLLVGTNLGIYEIQNGVLDDSELYQEFDGMLLRSMSPSRDGGFWVATHSSGIAKVSSNNEVRWFGTHDGLSSMSVRSICEDSFGSVWIGTSRGLDVYRDGGIQHIKETGESTVLSINEFSGVDHEIFVGTDGDGFYIIGNDAVRHYGREQGIPSDVIFYGQRDEEDRIWISSNRGLIVMDERAESIEVLDSMSGLPTDSIFYTVEDDLDQLWLAGNSQLFMLPKQRLLDFIEGKVDHLDYREFSKPDGLPSSPTGVTHPKILKDGSIWIPTLTGITRIDPHSLGGDAMSPPVVIESIETDRGLVSAVSGKDIVLEKGTRRVTFNFAAFSFNSPKENQYSVRLVGFEDDWLDVGTKRSHSFTNLRPGEYIFEVKARNYADVHSEHPVRLAFVLLPHFYETLSFKILLVFCIFLGLFLIYRIRVRIYRYNELKLERQIERRTEDFKIAAERAEAAAKEAEKANLLKSRFLATISHEFRNPMNGILGISELMLVSETDERKLEQLQIIKESSESLLDLLNDLLDASKIESDEFSLEQIPFSLSKVIGDAVMLMDSRAKEKHLGLSYDIPVSIEGQYLGDPLRIRQVILNLLSNAIKFTKQGSVRIRVRSEGIENEFCVLHFVVEDTGIGIPEESRQRIFEPYLQGDQSVSRRFGGTGLGLSICKKLISLMGGEIWIESAKPCGSIFHFTIKVKPSSGGSDEQNSDV